MAGSGSIRFSPAKPIPSPKHLALAPPGNDAGGSILAAKVAHFLAAVNIRLANAGFPAPRGLILAVSI